MTDEVVVLRKDMHSLKYCAKGGRRFCLRHGLSWNDFLDHGFPSKVLEATGDGMAMKLIEQARRRIDGRE